MRMGLTRRFWALLLLDVVVVVVLGGLGVAARAMGLGSDSLVLLIVLITLGLIVRVVALSVSNTVQARNERRILALNLIGALFAGLFFVLGYYDSEVLIGAFPDFARMESYAPLAIIGSLAVAGVVIALKRAYDAALAGSAESHVDDDAEPNTESAIPLKAREKFARNMLVSADPIGAVTPDGASRPGGTRDMGGKREAAEPGASSGQASEAGKQGQSQAKSEDADRARRRSSFWSAVGMIALGAAVLGFSIFLVQSSDATLLGEVSQGKIEGVMRSIVYVAIVAVCIIASLVLVGAALYALWKAFRGIGDRSGKGSWAESDAFIAVVSFIVFLGLCIFVFLFGDGNALEVLLGQVASQGVPAAVVGFALLLMFAVVATYLIFAVLQYAVVRRKSLVDASDALANVLVYYVCFALSQVIRYLFFFPDFLKYMLDALPDEQENSAAESSQLEGGENGQTDEHDGRGGQNG